MSFIHIAYDNIYDLISKFEKINFNNHIIDDTCNFVLVDESLYMGNYGGIYSHEMLKVFEKRNTPMIYDLLTPNLCLIWWEGFCSSRGDMSLCKNGLVLVTKNMFQKMKKKRCIKKPKSSYF